MARMLGIGLGVCLPLAAWADVAPSGGCGCDVSAAPMASLVVVGLAAASTLLRR